MPGEKMNNYNDVISRSTEKMIKDIEHDILINLFLKNKDNPEQSDLIDRIKKKYKDLYKVEFKEIKGMKLTPMLLITPDGTDITENYINKVKEICNDLDINVKINPTTIHKNDYVIITYEGYKNLTTFANSNQQDLSKLSNSSGLTLLLKNNLNNETFINLLSYNSKEKFQLSFITDEQNLSSLEFLAAIRTRFLPIFIPDAPKPLKDNALNNIDNIREKMKNPLLNKEQKGIRKLSSN